MNRMKYLNSMRFYIRTHDPRDQAVVSRVTHPWKRMRNVISGNFQLIEHEIFANKN